MNLPGKNIIVPDRPSRDASAILPYAPPSETARPSRDDRQPPQRLHHPIDVDVEFKRQSSNWMKCLIERLAGKGLPSHSGR